jgi:hypothetical protein
MAFAKILKYVFRGINTEATRLEANLSKLIDCMVKDMQKKPEKVDASLQASKTVYNVLASLALGKP